MSSNPAGRRAERDRVVEMSLRLFPRLGPAYALIGALLLASVPTFGWWMISLVIIDGAKAVANQAVALRSKEPEWFFAFDQYTSMALIAYGIYHSGGAASPFFPLLGLYAALMPAIFGRFLFKTSMTILSLCIVLAGLGDPAIAAGTGWLRIGGLLALALSAVICVSALFDSDTQHRRASRIDGLTGLPNRRSFNEKMRRLSEQNDVVPSATSLVVVDIDFFKRVNDEFGHDRGDEVLVAVARELDAAFRATDLAYRVGGEEFAVILPAVDSSRAAAMAQSLCERIRTARPGDIDLTASFGIASTDGSVTPSDLYRQADQALFEAKRAGRDCVMVAHPTHVPLTPIVQAEEADIETSPPRWDLERLTGVEDVVGVEESFDGSLGRQRNGIDLVVDEGALERANTVLGRDRSSERK